MLNPSHITLEEMKLEADLFESVYPDLMGEIERVENERGKLNDFQLMMAVSYAKNFLGVLNYERRQTINAIFTTFTNIYRKDGRLAADRWVQDHFGFGAGVPHTEEANAEVAARIEELSTVIREKETELLKIYREFYMLHSYLEQDNAGSAENRHNEQSFPHT